MTRFKAVLFDFDGVVVHSTPIHLDGWASAYHAMFQKSVDEALLQTLVGQSTAAIGTLLAEKCGVSNAKSELIQRKARYVLGHLEDIPLIPGIMQFLERLTAAKIPYGIASNAPRNFIDAALRRHAVPYSFFLGLEDYVRPKPDPEPYLKGALNLAWDPGKHSEIAVFEGSAHGIEAATLAGMTAIGVTSQRNDQLLLEAGARYCIKDFRDLKFLDRHLFS
ncbi:MAG: HAD family phosphatase [Oligoflexus sp.]|nr:HAD family phosphatase [Oligoflexus sp.]